MKIIKLKIPYHRLGKSYRFSVQVPSTLGSIVGVAAYVPYDDTPSSTQDNVTYYAPISDAVMYSTAPFAKIAVSTADGEVITPCVPVMADVPALRSKMKVATLNQRTVPVSCVQANGKITVVLDELVKYTPLVHGRVKLHTYDLHVYLIDRKETDND